MGRWNTFVSVFPMNILDVVVPLEVDPPEVDPPEVDPPEVDPPEVEPPLDDKPEPLPVVSVPPLGK